MESAFSRGNRGFSLVEVCLAILVVALGLLAVFGLFPLGLQAGESAEGDTYSALFADSVLAMIAGNASTMTVWSAWTDDKAFKGSVITKGMQPEVQFTGMSTNGLVNFPAPSESWLRYKLDVLSASSPRLKGVVLHVCPGQYGAFTNEERYYAEVYFPGL